MVSVIEIRDELGSPTEEEISDSTLARLLEEEKTLHGAAYRAAEILARKYAGEADVSVGNYRESLSQVSKRWQELAEVLKRKAAMHGRPYAQPAQPKPDFWKGMWDNRYT